MSHIKEIARRAVLATGLSYPDYTFTNHVAEHDKDPAKVQILMALEQAFTDSLAVYGDGDASVLEISPRHVPRSLDQVMSNIKLAIALCDHARENQGRKIHLRVKSKGADKGLPAITLQLGEEDRSGKVTYAGASLEVCVKGTLDLPYLLIYWSW